MFCCCFCSFRGRGAVSWFKGSWGIPPPRGTADHDQTSDQSDASRDLQRHTVPLSACHRQARRNAQVSAAQWEALGLWPGRSGLAVVWQTCDFVSGTEKWRRPLKLWNTGIVAGRRPAELLCSICSSTTSTPSWGISRGSLCPPWPLQLSPAPADPSCVDCSPDGAHAATSVK